MRLQTKRIYEAAARGDGKRILIDRLWPRGVSKEKAAIDFWAKEAAPSTELRKWYQHTPEKWPAFQQRYFAELEAQPEIVAELESELASGINTIVFGSKELVQNNATALILFLESRRR
ncbi:MAG: DUF488 domain-containing protein [Myxococcota bacterium]